MYWHVLLYVLVCIVQVFGMYYEMIPTSSHYLAFAQTTKQRKLAWAMK